MSVDIRELAKRYESLREQRLPWDSAWAELADHFLPTRWRAERDASSSPRLLNSRLMDSTGVIDMRTLAAGLHGGMTSPSRPWFSLAVHEPDTCDQQVATWLEKVSGIIRNALHRSNFYTVIHAFYSDIGTFGTGLLVETFDTDGLYFQSVRPGEYVLDTDQNNRVNTFFRRISMTPAQLVAEFGSHGLPDSICNPRYDEMARDFRRLDVIHAVFPRTNARRLPGAKNMPYASVYWLAESAERGRPLVLRESGFHEFPAFAPRWDVSGTDVYGRSPAMDILPDCRMLQGMVATLRKMQHKIADPPLAVDASLLSAGVELMPGGLNFVSSGREAASAIVPIQQPDANALRWTMQSIDDVRKIIHDGLYASLFKMLIETDRKQITATEIEAIEQERILLIGPVVERLHHELLAPVVERSFHLLSRAGLLPPPPASLKEHPIKVNFLSALAKAQQRASVAPLEQVLQMAATASRTYPDLSDSIDPDRLMELYVEALSAPASVLRTKQERDTLRKSRLWQTELAHEQEAINQAEKITTAFKTACEAVKALAATPINEQDTNALGLLLHLLKTQPELESLFPNPPVDRTQPETDALKQLAPLPSPERDMVQPDKHPSPKDSHV